VPDFSAGVSQYLLIDIKLQKESDNSNNRRKTFKLSFVHLDNACPPNCKQPQESIQASKAKRLPHPVQSLDLAPSNFFLFGNLKEKLTGFHCPTRSELKSTISTIFAEIHRESLLAVFNSW
jgi:hypothetical protein